MALFFVLKNYFKPYCCNTYQSGFSHTDKPTLPETQKTLKFDCST